LAAYRKANIMKKVATEILEWIDKKIEMVTYLKDKEQDKIKPKGINI